MDIQEIQPEEIGKIENGRVTPSPQKPVIEPEVKAEPQKESIISMDQIQEVGQKLAEMAVSLLEPEYQAKLDEKESALGELATEKEKSERTFSETQENDRKETEKKDKETETKHKSELKTKDTEIASLKKQITQKEKELKQLFKDVKEALMEEESDE